MLPLPASVLPLCEIAKYWSREIGKLLTCREIFDELLSSFWLDKLRGRPVESEPRRDRRIDFGGRDLGHRLEPTSPGGLRIIGACLAHRNARLLRERSVCVGCTLTGGVPPVHLLLWGWRRRFSSRRVPHTLQTAILKYYATTGSNVATSQ
jgi:hypothetical protein